MQETLKEFLNNWVKLKSFFISERKLSTIKFLKRGKNLSGIMTVL